MQQSVLIDASNHAVIKSAQELTAEREGLALQLYGSEAAKQAVHARAPLYVILELDNKNWRARVQRMLGARPERARTYFFFAFKSGEAVRELEKIGDAAYEFIVHPYHAPELRHRMRRWVRSYGEPRARVGGIESEGASLQPLRTSLVGENGQLDAQRVATYLGMPLKTLARALGAKYTTVHKTPATRALAPKLEPIARVLEVLSESLGDKRSVRAWLHAPHPELGQRTPLSVILEGHAQIVADMVEGARMGLPT